jgi:hypothetical protein
VPEQDVLDAALVSTLQSPDGERGHFCHSLFVGRFGTRLVVVCPMKINLIDTLAAVLCPGARALLKHPQSRRPLSPVTLVNLAYGISEDRLGRSIVVHWSLRESGLQYIARETLPSRFHSAEPQNFVTGVEARSRAAPRRAGAGRGRARGRRRKKTLTRPPRVPDACVT